MQQIKAAVLKSRLAFVERQSGKRAVEQVLAVLPPDIRTLRMLFTSNWYPFAIGKALDRPDRPRACLRPTMPRRSARRTA